MNNVETVELFSGWTSTVQAVQASLGEQPRDRLLGVSLCSEDGFCHVFMSFRTLDEVVAEIAKNAYPRGEGEPLGGLWAALHPPPGRRALARVDLHQGLKLRHGNGSLLKIER